MVKQLLRWRVGSGLALTCLTALLVVLMLSALPVVVDARPALVLAGIAAALALATARSQVASRMGRTLVVACITFDGVVALWAARDRWLVIRSEEVRFPGGGGAELAGTLYLPRGGTRHAAIVMVHGSGRMTRGELRYYAGLYARAGLVALAYDKRGTGASTGDFGAAAYEEFAADAAAAVAMLRSRPDVDTARVGIWALSEGEWVGALAAVESKPAFLVIVSPSAMTPSMQVQFEVRANVLKAGFDTAAADRAAELYSRLAAFQRTGEGRTDLNILLAKAASESWFRAATYLEQSVPEYSRVLTIDWFPSWKRRMDFDALPHLARLRCPILAQVGSDDPKNDGQGALDRLRGAAANGGNSRFTGILYPGAGHNVIVWPLPGHIPPPWFARSYLRDQVQWVLRAISIG